jgi:hypothetical protein
MPKFTATEVPLNAELAMDVLLSEIFRAIAAVLNYWHELGGSQGTSAKNVTPSSSQRDI